MAPHARPSLDTLLAQCACEPIHRLGRTQRFGFLLAFDAARRVAAVSDNAEDWLAEPADQLLGRPVDTLLPAQAVAAAEAHARVAAWRDTAQRLPHVAWPGRARPVDVSVHRSGGWTVLEAEPSGEEPADAAMAVQACALDLAQSLGTAELARSAVQAVARITGFDRVMLYRFAADGSGTVMAEHLRQPQRSYLGLRYPASDIPAQARALYLRNLTRVIADTGDEGVPLVVRSAEPPDLSLAVLRSVSPVHLVYMRNMGSAASMSISLTVDGRLWGLIACHHRTPLRPPLACRAMAEMLGRLYSLAFARAERQGLDADVKLLLLPPGVDPLVNPGVDPAARTAAAAAVARLLQLSGVVVRVGRDVLTWGLVPARPERLLARLAAPAAASAPMLAVESLAALDPALAGLAPDIAGVLALPLSAHGHDCVLLLRDEVARHVVWAGNPNKAVDWRSGRLKPRASFEAWREQVRGQCEPWTIAELDLAQVLRVRLLENIVAHREQRELESARSAAEKQALLVRELNHRVRNMLGLIKGLVHQTARGAASVEDLSQRLHERVHALSRAYTQIERAQWKPSPIERLVAEETQAFAEPGQVQCSGDPVELEPNAYLSFALVVHELATNARKYGALSVPEGRLAVHWQLGPGGTLAIDWRETGGPPVRPPAQRGFGTRVIAQALAHHLGGGAEIEFAPQGLSARLHAARGFRAGRRTPVAAALAAAPRPPRRLPESVLVVEDDVVIAMLAESLLQHLGCPRVVVAGTQDDALRALEAQHFDAAVLDVDLGDHTSEQVATRLAAHGVHTILATGYSDTDVLPVPLRGLRRIFKPYDGSELQRALTEA